MFHRAVPMISDPVDFLTSCREMERESGSLDYSADPWMHELHSQRGDVVPELPWLDADLAYYIIVNSVPGHDVAVALDFRHSMHEPRVVASEWTDDGCRWCLCAQTFSEFAAMLDL